MENFTNNLINWVAQYPNAIALAIFFAAFLESLALAGIVVPGVVILFGLAALAGSGPLTLPLTLAAACFGAVVGDVTSFYLGRHLGQDLKTIWPLSKYPELVKRSEDFFYQHGGKSVFIGRFVGPIRPVLPAMAGAFGMPAQRFIMLNIASALLWAPWYILPGYLFGAAASLEQQLPPHFYPTLLILISCILGIAGLFAQLHWQFRSQGRLYHWLLRLIQRSDRIRRTWQNSYSCRQQIREYPLNSGLLFAFGLAGLLLITLLTLYLPPLKAADQWVLFQLSALHIRITNIIFCALTLLGDPLFAYLLMVWFIILVSAQRKLQLAAVYVAAGLMTHTLTSWLKNSFEIMRPNSAFAPESFAFPSGHASGATLVFGLITASLARERPPNQRWPLYTGASVIILLIAASRLYLGVHWLSDIVAGLLLGVMVCGLVRIVQSPFDREPLWNSPWTAILLTGMVVITACYQGFYLPQALIDYGANLR